jgi:hypothetical protein
LDDGNRAKAQKHGLTPDEIEYALAHGARVAADPAHSLTEERFVAVSATAAGRPIFIAYCWRGNRVRPISARYMHEREARRHAFKTTDRPEDDHR